MEFTSSSDGLISLIPIYGPWIIFGVAFESAGVPLPGETILFGAASARRGTLSASGRPSIDVGSPPEFKGEPDIWAPEELLVGSVNRCMKLTFLTLAQAKGLTPVRYESKAEGLRKNIEGRYRITEVMVRPRVCYLGRTGREGREVNVTRLS